MYKKNGTMVYFLVYIDDILISRNQPSIVIDFFHKLKRHFKMKELNNLSMFSDIQTINDGSSLMFTQQHYDVKIFPRVGI